MILPFAVIAILGLSGMAAQLIVLRELFVAFQSNELSVAVSLATWLICEACGTLAAGRRLNKIKDREAAFVWVTLIFSYSLPLAVVLVRSWRLIAGAIPGEGLGLHQALLASAASMFPISAAHGALFTIAVAWLTRLRPRDEKREAALTYSLETLGALIGGVVFTYLPVIRIHSFNLASALALANSTACLIMLRRPAPRTKGRTFAAAGSWAALITAAAVLFSPIGDGLHSATLRLFWFPHQVVFSENSVYGNVSVVKTAEQYTFSGNGLPVITAPTPDIVAVEEMAHLPLLSHPRPRRVLIISGGAGGIIGQALRHPVESLDYVELDPLLIDALRLFPTPMTEAELGDPRVHTRLTDGRRFLRRSAEGYDVILIGPSDPSDLQLNRYFTEEFFDLAGKRLRPGGILAVRLPGSLTYMSPELKKLHACLLRTICSRFPAVSVLPGDGLTLFLAASAQPAPAADPDALLKRFRERGLAPNFVGADYLAYKLDRQWTRWYLESLAGTSAGPNKDFRPLAVLHSISYWNSLFAPFLRRLYGHADRITLLWALLAVSVLAAAVMAFLRKRRNRLGISLVFSIAATGAAGMIFNVAIIFAFQSLEGYLFARIGLVLAAFMAGTAAGGFLISRLSGSPERDAAGFARLEAATALFALFLALTFNFLQLLPTGADITAFVMPLFLILAVAAGALVGMAFPLAVRLRRHESDTVERVVGRLYGADLIGGWLGGMVGGAVLLPSLGLPGTCLAVGFLKIASLAIFFAVRKTQPA